MTGSEQIGTFFLFRSNGANIFSCEKGTSQFPLQKCHIVLQNETDTFS